MDPLAVVARLGGIAPRGAAGDGERRAAVWLRDQLRAAGGHASLQTIWVRPRWELAAALGVTLALAGSVTSVWQPTPGLALLAAALVGLVGEFSGRALLLRRLLPERATQNLISTAGGDLRVADPAEAADAPDAPRDGRVELVVAANLDAGRAGAIYADRWSTLEGRLRRLADGHLSSPTAILTADVAGLVAVAAIRAAGTGGAVVSVAQFALTAVLVIALAALLDIALADVSPGANVNATGVAVAVALVEALEEIALRRLNVTLALTGAGDPGALGMRAFVAERRRRWRPEDVIVLAIEPCGAGTPHWLERDGRLLGLRFHPRLRALMQTVATQERHLHAEPLRSHGCSEAYPARLAGWPAIAVGCHDELGRTPHAREPNDVYEAIDAASLEATLELCLAFVGQLDAELVAGQRPPG
jgi:hypothetical protein